MPFRSLLLPTLLAAALLCRSGCLILSDDDDCCRTDVEVSQSFSETIRVTGQVRLRLETINGNVEINGSRAVQSIRIEGTKRVGSFSRSDADRHLDDLRMVIQERPDEIHLRTEQPKDDGRNYVVDCTITLPAGLFAAVEHINGNILIGDVENGVFVDAVNGNVVLADVAGDAAVNLVNGNIDGAVTLPPDGTVDLATTNGNVFLAVPRATSAMFTATVTNGSIDAAGLPLADVVVGARSVRGRLGAGDGTITLRTVNGTIVARTR